MDNQQYSNFLSARNTVSLPARSATPHAQVQREEPETIPQSTPPRLGQVSYPKLPSTFSPPRNSLHLRSKQREPASEFSPPSGPRANIGRRRANAVSLINSPARHGQSLEMNRIFYQARQTMRSQGGAMERWSKVSGSDLKGYAQKNQSASNVFQKSSSPSTLKPASPRSKSFSPSSRLPPLTSAVTARPFIPRSIAPINSPDTSSSRKALLPARHLPSMASRSPSNHDVESTGDWTDDEIYYRPKSPRPTSRLTSIETWLEDISNNEPAPSSPGTSDPPNASESSATVTDSPSVRQCRQSTAVQERPRSKSGSAIAEKIQRIHLTRSNSHTGEMEVASNSSDNHKDNPGVLKHLLQQPLRTPRRKKASTELASSAKSGSHIENDQKHQSSEAEHSSSTTVKEEAVMDNNQGVRFQSSDSAPDSHSSPSSDGNFRLVVRRRRIPTHEKVEDKIGLRDLTPEVETTRKGKGRKTKTRCASYFDEDVISHPRSPSPDSDPDSGATC